MERGINIKAEDRLGLEKKNKFGTTMRIVKVLPNDKLMVRFQDEFACTKEIHWNNYKSGNVKNPYDRTNGGVGYIGEGKHKTKCNNRNTRMHNTWNDMLARCYKEQSRFKYTAYKDCEVCEEWHNFQNFADWYEKNYYDIGEGRMHLDKDILCIGNRIYSPKYCVFVPQRINMIFTSKPNKYSLPSGISRTGKGYRSTYNTKTLGICKTLEEALIPYNKEKMEHIHNIAEEYKTKIPKRLYSVLKNYKLQ